jgi:dTDP-4-dehydrorhamnose reductase
MIGLELNHQSGLVEWFLRQSGDVPGFRRAIWSGLTTAELASLIERIVRHHDDLHGIWHVSSRPISKYQLLRTLGQLIGRPGKVFGDDGVVIDRSLNSEKFQMETGYQAPDHETMLAELASEIRQRKEINVA